MEVNLRKRVVGGWWQGIGGLGEDYDYGGEYGNVYPSDVVFATDVYGEPWPEYGTDPIWPEYDASNPIFGPPVDPANDSYLAVLADAAAHPGDYGTPYGTPTALAITNAITKFATMGIRAVAPSTTTGTCPAGYVRSGAACVPAPTSGAPSANPQWIPGVSNSTLLIAGVGILFLGLLSGGRGRR